MAPRSKDVDEEMDVDMSDKEELDEQIGDEMDEEEDEDEDEEDAEGEEDADGEVLNANQEDEQDDGEPEEINEELEKFLVELQEYHDKRGTLLDAHPKVGSFHVNLLEFYNKVVSEGGYDKVSDTKGNKLAWRRLCEEFLPKGANPITLAFLLKTCYYKNLAAYEISTLHKRVPPPKEILEDLTAKGGDLLNRTLDNYHRRAPLETEKLGNGQEGSDADDDDKMDGDGPRTRAGLRQAPPQRILYGQQPEIKQTRSGYAYSSPVLGQANGLNGAAVSIANYEPRQAAPTMVRPVMTPSNNAQYFRDLARRHKDSLRRNKGLAIPKGMMLPGTGYLGTSIYVRCNMALQSGMKDEVKYALHHFTKISFERTDKFLFSGWPNLGETLLRLGCAVSRLWYDHPGWQFSWEDEVSDKPTVLNELNGTPDILQKIESFKQLPISTVHTSDWQTDMNIVYQACLVLRNMITIDANAEYLSTTPLVRDLITILLQLPKAPETIELKYYALDIAESLTKFWALEAEDGVYVSLIKTVEENIYDRGLIIMGLRALSRISMNLDTTNRLKDVPVSLLTYIAQFLLVEDEDLRGACLDFLYQYTAVTENVQFLVKNVETEALVDTLMQFLMLGAVRITHTSRQDMPPATPVPAEVSETLPKLAPSIIEKLCQMNDAKDQSTTWLKSCFIEHASGEITQLALWSAYNEAFTSRAGEPTRNLMVAKDFITNVTSVFPGAVARVVYPDESDRTKVKYTMKGIAPRATPVDLRGRPYVRCQWKIPVALSTEDVDMTDGQVHRSRGPMHKDCDLWFAPNNVEEMWAHIVETHLEVPRDPDTPATKFKDGLLKGSGRRFACLWSGCYRYPEPGVEDAYKVSMHVKIHLPDFGPGASARAKFTAAPGLDGSDSRNGFGKRPRSESLGKPAKLERFYLNTALDERGQATGLPLAGMLVLRNLARQMLKIDKNSPRQHLQEAKLGKSGTMTLVERHFGGHEEKLFHVMTYNYSLRAFAPEFLQYVSKGLLDRDELVENMEKRLRVDPELEA